MNDGQLDFAAMIEDMNLPPDQIQTYLMGLQQQHLMQFLLANMPAAAFQGGEGSNDGSEAAASMAQMAQLMGLSPGMAQSGSMGPMDNLLGQLPGGSAVQAPAAAAANQVRASCTGRRLGVSDELIMVENRCLAISSRSTMRT